ncbi:MAG: outer membrane lipoprotein-sorting protein [Acidobacteriales bacterium]|nr:outer membrane lipoprotein-sorting protein [Terriglobales bacterium]
MKQLRTPSLIVLISLAAYLAAAQAGSTVPDVATIIAGVEQAKADNRANYRPYRVFRDYKFLDGKREKVNAQVMAQVDFQPPDTKSYVIREASGNERGEKLVRKMLEHERATSRQHSDVELSAESYAFVLLRQELWNGARCYVIELTPKRKEKNLLKGSMWVDAKTYLIHHIEGELAKSPSFWLKEIHLSMDFSSVEGMWLRTSTEAVASVRFFGKHTMQERDVKYETAPVAAGDTSPKRTRIASARRTVIATPALVRP